MFFGALFLCGIKSAYPPNLQNNFNQGTTPLILKTSHITPIFKSDQTTQIIIHSNIYDLFRKAGYYLQ